MRATLTSKTIRHYDENGDVAYLDVVGGVGGKLSCIRSIGDRQYKNLSAICDRELARVGLAADLRAVVEEDKAHGGFKVSVYYSSRFQKSYSAHTMQAIKAWIAQEYPDAKVENKAGLSSLCDRELERVGLATDEDDETLKEAVRFMIEKMRSGVSEDDAIERASRRFRINDQTLADALTRSGR